MVRTYPVYNPATGERGNYYLLHDGRAHSIDEAIRLHGGEAGISAERYKQLSKAEQNSIIHFLKSL